MSQRKPGNTEEKNDPSRMIETVLEGDFVLVSGYSCFTSTDWTCDPYVDPQELWDGEVVCVDCLGWSGSVLLKQDRVFASCGNPHFF